MMNEILLNGISLDEFLEKIEKLLEVRLKALDKTEERSVMLSRKEVAKLLKITLPTLHDWTKLGWLKSYKLGNRVLYDFSEVQEALRENNINKHSRKIL